MIDAHVPRIAFALLSLTALLPLAAQADFDLRIRAQTLDGAPRVEHPVLIRFDCGKTRWTTFRTSDADGRITLQNVRAHVASHLRGGEAIPANATFEVVSQWPVAASYDRKFTLAAPPTGDVELRVPELERVRVALVVPGSNRDATLPVAQVWLRPRPADFAPTGRFVHDEREVRGEQSAGNQAWVRLSPGVRYVLQARLQGHEIVDVPLDVPENLDAIEASIDVPIEGAAVVTGCVRTESGEPLRSTELRLLLRAENGANAEHAIGTDRDGRFVAVLRAHGERGWHARIVTPATAPTSPMQAVLPLPSPLVAGRTDVGDVTTAIGKVLASGRVVDRNGGNVFQPRLHVEVRSGDGWRHDPDLAVDVQRTGRFTIRGVVDADALRLVASRDGYRCLEPTVVRIGTKDVRVVVDAVGRLRGSVRAHPAIVGAGLVTIGWRREGDAAPDERDAVLVASIDPKGNFVLPDLVPGRYEITFHLAGRVPQLRIADVDVGAARESIDDRLQGIDLTAVTPVRVTVRDESGRPLPGEVRIVGDGGVMADPLPFEIARDGSVLLARGDAPLRLCVRADGHLAKFVDGVDGDREVTLDAAPKITLTPRAGGVPWPSDVSCRIELVPRDIGPLASAPALASRADVVDGRAELLAQRVGRHAVILYGRDGVAHRTDVEVDVRSDPSRERAPIVVDLPAELLARLRGGR